MGGTQQKNRQNFTGSAGGEASHKNLSRRRRGPAKERIPLRWERIRKWEVPFHRKRSVKDGLLRCIQGHKDASSFWHA
ncbi:hypothetical protein CEXT_239031 [Caerostris extrusa]|uniref:Uncharacterized protein n=1 Tax=Caerostris extrusa TaxID=172846 RepID=A0AAV4R8V6_CAEEX|nr:hypothetical protein CEXT_239031 [Caerostris extrusa]